MEIKKGTVKIAPLMPTTLGLAGHNGVGHAVSHSGFLQDDSLGFTGVVRFLSQACPFNLVISAISFDSHTINIELGKTGNKEGSCGVGTASTSQALTHYEKKIMEKAVGQTYLTPQALTCEIFGKIYGHGVTESATAFNLALSRAIIDSIRKNWGETLHAYDNVPESCGEFLGGVLFLDDLPVSWLITINSSPGGAGPNEDSEGMIPIGNKGKLIADLGMNAIPVLILESHAYVPAFKDKIEKNEYLVRWNEEIDNPSVGKSLVKALETLQLPYQVDDKAYARNDSLEKETQRVGNAIADLGQQYAKAATSAQKVRLAAELSRLIAQDVGGSIFMSSALFKLVAGGGLWPGQSAVLSVLTCKNEIDKNHVTRVSEEELSDFTRIISHALVYLYEDKEAALSFVKTRDLNMSPDELLTLAGAV